MAALDWQGVLTGQPLQWIVSGFLTTLWVTLAGVVLATLLALFFLLLRLSAGRFGHAVVSGWVSLFRNTPLLVQLLFWYFAAWNGLPLGFRDGWTRCFEAAGGMWSVLTKHPQGWAGAERDRVIELCQVATIGPRAMLIR